MIPRRRASELLTLYAADPKVKDIIVEGPGDAAILQHVVGGTMRAGSKILDSSRIEFDLDTTPGLDGARGRVLRFALEMDRTGIVDPTCVIDCDLDTVLESLPQLSCLLPTRFSNLLMHIFEPFAFEQYTKRVYFKDLPRSDLDGCINIARTLFGVRCVSKKRNIEGAFVSLDKLLDFKSDAIVFDLDEFLIRMDSKNGTSPFWRNARDEIDDIIRGFAGESRMYINDHDLGDIVRWVLVNIHRIVDKSFSDENWFSRALRANINAIDVSSDEFFQSIRSRAG